MASTTAEEQAYLDGTHPNLVGGNTTSSALERADSLSPPSSPAFKAIDNEPPTGPIPALNPPARGGGASNTGPKGVLADWRASNGMNAGAASNTGPKGVLADYHANGSGNVSGLMAGVGKMKVTQIRLEGEEEDDDGGEEEARERYRRQRVLEMSGSGSQVRRKTFGHLREIGVEQFLGAIEGEEEHVPVVLHLYEPDIPACLLVNHHLSSIARACPSTKFLRARATEIEFATNAEDDTLPTILIYRGGELETTMVRPDLLWGEGTRSDLFSMLLLKNAVQSGDEQSLPGAGGAIRDRQLSDDSSDSGDSD